MNKGISYERVKVPIAVIIGIGVLCSCKKSEENQISSVPQKVVEMTTASVTNWAMTNGLNLQSNGQAFSQILTGYEAAAHTFGMGLTNEIFLETGRAEEALKRLRNEGNLPGASKDQHGEVTSDAFFWYSPSNNLNVVIFSNIGTTITYPVSRTIHLVKHGDTSTNNYTLFKQTKDGEWKLRRAWETDSNGETIQEWPVH
jgi:hypothetical protein